MKTLNERLIISRRRLFAACLSLSAFLLFKRGLPKTQTSDETVLAGRWVLKKSDLS